MKKLFLLAFLGGLVMSEQVIIKNGSLGGFEGDSKIFSGNVKVNMLFKETPFAPMSGALVEFDKNARTAWHLHPHGQTLVVTDGEIITKTPGQKAVITKKGDVISCPPGVRHFHGATDTSHGAHIALTQIKDGNSVEWMELISDAEYKQALTEARENH